MSKNTPLTSAEGFLSKLVCISWIINESWAIHESPDRKPDYKGVKFVIDKMVKQRILDYSFKYFAEDRKYADRTIVP